MKLLLLALVVSAGVRAQPFDIIIRNARVLDGTGNPWFRADVGVRGGRVAAIGKIDGAAARIIDARERYVAPGFIDVHTHIESNVKRFPQAENLLRDGVTTVVTGNCGSSETKVGPWLDELEKAGVGINVSTLIGHNSVRAAVMGRANRAATGEELARMQSLVEKAMADGAVGFSTGLIYIPGTYSNTEEIVALAKAASKFGGVYASHMRDEGEKVLDAINEAARVGQAAGMRVQLSHFKIDNKRLWGSSDKSLALVEEYRRKGLDVVVDQYPYDRSSTNLGIRLPSWALADGPERVRERLTNASTKAEIAAEMERMLHALGHDNYSSAMVASFPPDRSFEGKTITEIAKTKVSEPTLADEIQVIFDIMLAGNAQMVYHSMGEVDVDRIMRYPHTAIASDGGITEFGVGMPHPRSYGTNARVLAEYVRNRGVLTWEDAIRRMTTLPARTFNFRDRGILREGAAADILVIDPERIRDAATFTQPHQYSEGIDVVIVNGTVAVEDGKYTGARAGRALRRQ